MQSRPLSRSTSCDVLVLGGGSAGLAAGVAAARAGAKTILVERGGALGGMATASLVHSICGLFHMREAPGAVYAHGGFPREFAETLLAVGGAEGPVRMGRPDVLMHSPPVFAWLADEFVRREMLLEVLLHTEILAMERTAGRITLVETICRGERRSIHPDAVVDASGDGISAAFLGDDFDQTSKDKLQRPAYVVGLVGVHPESLTAEGRLGLSHRIASGIRAERLPRQVLGCSFRKGVGAVAHLSLDLDPPAGMDYDPHDALCLAAIEMEGRRIVMAILDFLRVEEPWFRDALISALPARAGVRESRRLRGRSLLDDKALLAGACSENDVALATWPMELRETTRGPRLIYQEGNKPSGIPLGCLQSAHEDNLFFAGRCISTTHEAQASTRVIGTCMATGEAAGIAASLSLNGMLTPGAVRARNGWDRIATGSGPL